MCLNGNGLSLEITTYDCEDAECASYEQVGSRSVYSDGYEHQSTVRSMRVQFRQYASSAAGAAGNTTVSWSTGAQLPPVCAPCDAGTYKDSGASGECAACPSHAVSGPGSTSLAACECAPGFTGDAASGESCAPCAAGSYKDAAGPEACSACPSGAASPEGSTSASSCVCPAGYSGDAGAGESCEPCGAGRFKPYEGAGECMACPDGGESADEGRSCATCPLGTYLEDNVPRLTCASSSGSSDTSCPCVPSAGASSGTIELAWAGTQGSWRSCTYVISGPAPRLQVGSFNSDGRSLSITTYDSRNGMDPK